MVGKCLKWRTAVSTSFSLFFFFRFPCTTKTPRHNLRGPDGRFISRSDYLSNFQTEPPVAVCDMATSKTLREKNGASIRAAPNEDLLVDACLWAGIQIHPNGRTNIPYMQRELMRRIAAQAVIRNFPNAPTKNILDQEILVSAEEYTVLLDNRFSREEQRQNSLNFSASYVNKFLPTEWAQPNQLEGDPFLPPYDYSKEKAGAVADNATAEGATGGAAAAGKAKVNKTEQENSPNKNRTPNKDTTEKDIKPNAQIRSELGGAGVDVDSDPDFALPTAEEIKARQQVSQDYWKKFTNTNQHFMSYCNPQQPRDGKGQSRRSSTFYAGDLNTQHILRDLRRQYGDTNDQDDHSNEQDDHRNSQRNRRNSNSSTGRQSQFPDQRRHPTARRNIGHGGDDPGDSSDDGGDGNRGRGNPNRGRRDPVHRRGRGQRQPRGRRDDDDQDDEAQDGAPTDRDRRALTGLQASVTLFTGQMPYNFREWFRRFELRTAGCTGKQKCLGLAMLMDGHAAVLYSRLPEQVRFSYPDIVEELYRLFAPPENMDAIMQKFREHYQQPDVDVFQYVNELRSILASAGCDLPPAQYDLLIAQQFKLGLAPKWQREIARYFGTNVATLDDMVAHIATMALVDEREQNRKKVSFAPEKPAAFKTMRYTEEMKRADDLAQQEALNKDIAELPYPRAQTQQQPQGAWIDTQRRSNVKILGKPPLNQTRNTGGTPAQAAPSNKITCFVCEKEGHWAKDCPYIDEWRAKKAQALSEIRERIKKDNQNRNRNNTAINSNPLEIVDEEDEFDDSE